MGDFKQISKSGFGIDPEQQAKIEAQKWAQANDSRMNETNVLMSMLKWPINKFKDYRFEHANKMNPDVLSESQRLKQAMESVYDDGAISPEEAKMQDVIRWKALMRGEGF